MTKPLKGMRVVLAGDLEEDRSRLKRELQAKGAKVGSVVTPDTAALFAGRHAKHSKTEKAEELGVPVLGIAELRRLLETGSLEAAIEAPEPAPDHTPFPPIPIAPRIGEYVAYHPDGSVRCRGPRVDGLSHGEWTYFHPNEQPSSTVHYVRGLREGPSVGFYADGTKQWEGAYAGGHQHGAWDYWYASGAWKQRYIYDELGKTHGPYVWDQEDGSPRARGAFWHGSRDGEWEWHGEPKHERMIRGHHRGQNHGHDAAWFPGGQLAYSRHWKMGERVGEWLEHWPDGSAKLKHTYVDGVLHGEQRSWDEAGNETVTVWVEGLRQSVRDDEVLHAKVVAKVNGTRDEYRKRDAIADAVDYAESGPYLVWLWRTGKLELEAIPELWDGLRYKPFTPADVFTFLKNVQASALEKAYCEHLPAWPRELDALVCHAYDADPAAFEDWRSLSEPAKRGMAFVLARAGAPRDAWAELLAPAFDALVTRHVREYGLGERIWWWVDGELQEAHLYERRAEKQHRREPLPRFYELIEMFGDRDAWAKAVLRATMKHTKKEHRVPWESARDGLPLATRKQLLSLLDQSGYEPIVEDVFLEIRDDDATFLEELAIAAQRGRGKIVALCAAKKRLDAGERVSDALLDAIELDVGSYSHQWIDQTINRLPFEDIKHDPAYVDSIIDFREMRKGFTSATLAYEVFERLPAEQQRAKLEGVLDSQYGKSAAVPFLGLVEDPALWRRGIEAVESADDQSERASVGLAMLPDAALPNLVEALATAKKKMKPVWQRAIYGMLARMSDAGVSWDPALDAQLRTDLPIDRYQYEYGRSALAKVVHRLPVERAEPVLLRMLDPRRVTGFARAMRFVASHPTEAVLRQAMRGLLAIERDVPSNTDIELGLRALDEKRALIKWLLRNGAGATFERTFENVVGHQDWPKLKKELEDEGVETAFWQCH